MPITAALENLVFVVVGGTTGLGLSAAHAILQAGAAGLVVVGRNPDSVAAAETALDSRAVALAADARDPLTTPQAIELAHQRFGRFDGLYHVAGGSGRSLGDGPLHELTDDGLRGTLALNLESVVFSNRAAIRDFLSHGTAGVVLNLGSVLGWSPSPTHFSSHAYAAAKGGILGFSKAIAAAYAPHNIRVNVLAPALVETPMAQRAAHNPQILDFIRTKQPLDGGRIGQPSDADAAVVFLLSPAARFVTGQVLAVDGGWTVSEGQLTPPSLHP
jgi:NAD(P)-dependent dehydrogenase (short-subunit alcohol dehydrogenase family)